MELIEVQTGSYLDEDNIIHFHDVYGRKGKNKNLSKIKKKRSI
ncbi:hypothetical protein [Desulfovibrio sp. UCD-KL4C]|nr:hypothetical protein [Desulfovibrio sp. UCD-KL4C]